MLLIAGVRRRRDRCWCRIGSDDLAAQKPRSTRGSCGGGKVGGLVRVVARNSGSLAVSGMPVGAEVGVGGGGSGCRRVVILVVITRDAVSAARVLLMVV